MTKLTYEIYDVRTKDVALVFTDYDLMKQIMAELKAKSKEIGEYCPYSYRQAYTPIAQRDEDAKSYIEFYKNKFARVQKREPKGSSSFERCAVGRSATLLRFYHATAKNQIEKNI